VSESLAAWVNQWPGARSTDRWPGRVQTEPEATLAIRTRTDRFAAMEARLRALHPNEVPERVALEAVDGHIPYLDRVRAQVAP
jgi:periplasmic divalent cation tolerance protein